MYLYLFISYGRIDKRKGFVPFRFSFLMTIPANLGAAVLKLFDMDTADLAAKVGPYLVGMLVSGIIWYICIRWLKNLIQKDQFHYFGYYCLVERMLT